MRRRRKRNIIGEIGKPLLAFVLLGLLWAAYQIGLVDALTHVLFAPLAPE